MAIKKNKLLIVWLISLVTTVIAMIVMPNYFTIFIILVSLAVGLTIGNSLLDSAVERIDKKYRGKRGYNRMQLYNPLIIFSTSPLLKARIIVDSDAHEYQIDYRIAMLYCATFWLSALLYGIISSIYFTV